MSKGIATMTCKIDDCGKPAFCRGWCNMHYSRWQRHGDPLATKREPVQSMDYAGALCGVDGCEQTAKKRGMCNMHYQRWREGDGPGEATSRRKPRQGACKVEGCTGCIRAAGFCGMHYSRWSKNGDPGDVTPLRKGKRPCKVDTCANDAITRDDLCATHRRRKRLYGNPDGTFSTHKKCVECGGPAIATERTNEYCREHYVSYVKRLIVAGEIQGARVPQGYVVHGILKKRYAEHAIVMEAALGRPLLPRENIHHRNGVRDDNRPENLELWVKPQPAGQRVEDLVTWVVETYPDYVASAIASHPGLVQPQ